MAVSKQIDEALLTLAWSLWTELGVAGVERRHRECPVDPEALIFFTSSLASLDPRLRDESLDCALGLAPYLSTSRLKSLLAQSDASTRESFAPYAATFNRETRSHVRFPQAGEGKPWKIHRRGKSRREDFSEPGSLFLRLRALFGVDARAEVLRVFLCSRQQGWFATDVAERSGIAKRVAAGVLQDLARGGMLAAVTVGNRRRYDFMRRAETATMVGALPRWSPTWTKILPFLASARRLLQNTSGRREVALLVAAQKLVTGFLEEQLRLGSHESPPSFDSWPRVAEWLVAKARSVALGKPTWFEENLGAGKRR